MGNRGRPSAASILSEVKRIESTPRFPPPDDLDDEAAEIWTKVVNSHPPDWFTPANLPLLGQYCRHCVEVRFVGELIKKAKATKSTDLREFRSLLTMQRSETKMVAMLATKMRIGQQSVKNQRGNKKTVSSKPWEG